MLDSCATRCFFRDCTTVTPLTATVPVSLADPSGDPVVARASTVLPCPAAPSGSLTGFHLPSFSKNLVLRLDSDRGGEFSSVVLWDFFRAEGIRQTFTLPASPQQNGIAERRIGLVMGVARTPMIHGAAPHFMWPFAFYHPVLRRVLSSQDVTFDESICFYRLHPHTSSPLSPPPLFLVPGPPSLDPLPPQGPAPSGVSQVNPPPLVELLEVSSDTSGPAEGGVRI
ncbi:unnamed protein product [Closterium sp. NIES-53]